MASQWVKIMFHHSLLYVHARTAGAYGPLVLAPAEGVGALRAPCQVFLFLYIYIYIFLPNREKSSQATISEEYTQFVSRSFDIQDHRAIFSINIEISP